MNHDFYSNFSNSIKHGAIDTSIDIYKTELSDIVVYEYKKIYDLFKSIGITNFKETETDQQLVERIMAEAKSNDKLVRGLSFLIAQLNEVQKGLKKDENYIDALNKITDGIKVSIMELATSERKEKKFIADVLKDIEMKANKVGDRKRKVYNTSNKFMNVILLAGVIVGCYFLYKWYETLPDKSTPKLADGGSIAPTTTIAAAPITPATPADPMVAAANDPKYHVPPTVLDPKFNPIAPQNVNTPIVNQTDSAASNASASVAPIV
jgi:hypothetical protein